MTVENHRHCAICGKPIPISESFCSDNCQEQYQLKQQQVAKQRKILYGIVAIFIIVYVVMVIKPF